MEKGKKRSTRLREFKHCEVCEEDILHEKFGNHQFWLAGVRIPLCRGMPKARRRFYEEQSQKRVKKGKTLARSHGYRTEKEIEAFLRGMDFGQDCLPVKKKARR